VVPAGLFFRGASQGLIYRFVVGWYMLISSDSGVYRTGLLGEDHGHC